MTRTFLLSPAYAGGRRARMLLSGRAQFDLARRLRATEPVSLGEVFTFLSGLYFRGKLAYANAFARPDLARVLVITPTRGLVPAANPVTLAELREFAAVDIEEGDPRYRKPLERDLRSLVRQLSPACEVVLLGSVATGKYVSILLEILRERIRFPAEFVGRGDMSRGGLLLRCAVDRTELAYIPVQGAVRKGKRPPKLQPRRYAYPPLNTAKANRARSCRLRCARRPAATPIAGPVSRFRQGNVHLSISAPSSAR